MKASFLITIIIILVAIKSSNCQVNPLESNHWYCVFNDDFDGSTPDDTRWKIVEGFVRDLTHETSNCGYDKSCVTVNSGYLFLKTKREDIYLPNWELGCWEWTHYKAGEIDSKHNFRHGAFEMVCRVPDEFGIIPAFWLHGIGPCYANEIDIFEFFCGDPVNMWTTTHLVSNPKGCNLDNPDWGNGVDHPNSASNPIVFDMNFHSFLATWDDEGIGYYFDYQLVYYMPHYLDQIVVEGFPEYPMRIISNVAVYIPEKCDPSATPMPLSMQIDRISYYTKIDCNVDKVFNNKQSIYPDFFWSIPDQYNLIDYHHIITGRNITFNSTPINYTTILYSYKQILEVDATESIKIKSGFHAEAGSEVLLRIIPDCEDSKKPFEPIVYSNYSENTIKATSNVSDTINNPSTKSLSVYPNPSDGIFHINYNCAPGNCLYDIEIIDLYGQIIMSYKQVSTTDYLLDLSPLEKGVYCIRITDIFNSETLSEIVIYN